MARSGDNLGFAAMPRVSALIAFALAWIAPASAAADLNGHWRFVWVTASFSDIVQVGSGVSFTLVLPAPAGSVMFSGTVSGSSLMATAPNPSNPSCPLQLNATIAADENSLSGFTYNPCVSGSGIALTATRCECFDANSTGGDGCDSQCRIETCYSCSGDPSVCALVPDGTACDDQMACTSGETCTAGVCSGGSPVTPCIDMSGAWLLHYDFIDYPFDQDVPLVFTQHNDVLETSTMSGSIDPSTGSFSLTGPPNENGLCPGNVLSGQVSADGLTLSGNFSTYAGMFFCTSFDAVVTGARCGGGTLDAGEECDDGNRTNGDGCDTSCQIEPCYTCTGSPSDCTPLPDGTGCDDDEECTTTDVCTDAVCGGTAQPDGTSCSDGDICTQNDACAQAVCTGTPLACGPCEMCDGITPACVPRPDFSSCNDGDACTNGDICQAGTCAGSPIFCAPCTACDGAGGCVATLRSGCLAPTAPARSKLAMTDAAVPADDTLSWSWSRGPGSSVPDLGDPPQGTVYSLCVFDESTSPPTALITAPAQHIFCPDLHCWTSRRYGFSYRNPDGGDNGLTRIELRARPDGRMKALVRGKGSFLNPPHAPLSLPLRVQLQAFNETTCFEAEYDPAGVRVNDNGVFRANATGP